MSGHIQTLFCASYDCQNKCVVCSNQAIIGKKKDTYLSLHAGVKAKCRDVVLMGC